MKITIKSTSRSSSQSGFTLVELSIYMGLLTIFLFLLSGLFVSTLQVQRNSIDTARVEQDSHYVFTRLHYDINKADQLITPHNNGDTQNNLTLAQGLNTYNYFLHEGKLKVSDGVNTINLTSPGVIVTRLSFQRLGNSDGIPSIKVETEIQALDSLSSHPYKKELKFVLGLR